MVISTVVYYHFLSLITNLIPQYVILIQQFYILIIQVKNVRLNNQLSIFGKLISKR